MPPEGPAPQDYDRNPNRRSKARRRGNRAGASRRTEHDDEQRPASEAPMHTHQPPVPGAISDSGRMPDGLPNPPQTPTPQLTLRSDIPPVDELDLADRLNARATNDDQSLERSHKFVRHQMELERHRMKIEWYRTLQRLLTSVVGVIVCVASVVALSHLLPGITIGQAVMIVGLGMTSPASGYGLLLAIQALQRYHRRGGGSGEEPRSRP